MMVPFSDAYMRHSASISLTAQSFIFISLSLYKSYSLLHTDMYWYVSYIIYQYAQHYDKQLLNTISGYRLL